MNDKKHLNVFYDDYFKGEDYEAYKYDVGAFCTRKIIKGYIQHDTGNLLEIGTGLYPIIFDLSKFNCFGVDISKKTIEGNIKLSEFLKFKANFKIADGEALPFNSNLFDVIVSSHTLEHIENDLFTLRECFRVLKPEGEAIFFVPGRINGLATKSEWIKQGHYRSYNKKRFRTLEQQVLPNIFRITDIVFPHKIHNLIWNRVKHVIRWVNYPIKKWVMRDNLRYEQRLWYQTYILPAMVNILDFADKCTMQKEKNFLGAEFNVLVRFEKLKNDYF